MSEKCLPLPGKRQGTQKDANTSYDGELNKSFDIPDSIPGCYLNYGDPGEYRGIDGCASCVYRLPCARASAGGIRE